MRVSFWRNSFVEVGKGGVSTEWWGGGWRWLIRQLQMAGLHINARISPSTYLDRQLIFFPRGGSETTLSNQMDIFTVFSITSRHLSYDILQPHVDPNDHPSQKIVPIMQTVICLFQRNPPTDGRKG